MGGGRISRGWALTKKSWAVLRADRSLVLFPLISTICALIALAILLVPGVAIALVDDGQEWVIIPFLIVGGYAAVFVSIFFAVALAGAVGRSLAGENTSLGDGIRVARGRVGTIAAWALVQTTVGVLLSLVRDAAADSGNPITAILGGIFSAVMSIAWAIMTFFVVPVLAFEGLGPIAAIKRSLAIVRERWGEGVVGSFSIQGIAGLAALPGVALLVIGVLLVTSDSDAAGMGLIVVGAVLVAIPAVVANALQAIFRVVLYRFATTGDAMAGFEADELATAFVPKRRGRRAARV